MVTTKPGQELDGVTLTPEKLQTLRLMLMMYRQGWIDASVYLNMEAKKQAASIKKQYEELL